MKDDFEFWNSRTYKVLTGCGSLFVTILNEEGAIIRVIAHRKSCFECDITFLDALNRQTTFATNRELEQAIYDLKGNDTPKEGHYCRKFHAGVKGIIKRGGLGAYSCADAVARCLEKEITYAENELEGQSS